MKNSLTIKEISLYLEQVLYENKPVCLQIAFPGYKEEKLDIAKSGFSVYVIKKEITKQDI